MGCLSGYKQTVAKCDQSEDDGYSQCSETKDEGYSKCNGWGIFSFLCDAWVWVSNVVCVAWTWISHLFAWHGRSATWNPGPAPREPINVSDSSLGSSGCLPAATSVGTSMCPCCKKQEKVILRSRPILPLSRTGRTT
jgi:hypothetical protein